MSIIRKEYFAPLLESCNLKYYSYQLDPYRGCEFRCVYCSAVDVEGKPDIVITQDIKSQLAQEISGLQPQVIYLGMKSDPYQPCEAEQLQTRKVLEVLAVRGFSASILTKSDLVLRDVDLPRIGVKPLLLGMWI